MTDVGITPSLSPPHFSTVGVPPTVEGRGHDTPSFPLYPSTFSATMLSSCASSSDPGPIVSLHSALPVDPSSSSSLSSQLDSIASSDFSDPATSDDGQSPIDTDDDNDEAVTDNDDDDDDDEDAQPVFFGKPSAEEEETRRRYEARLKRKKLIRRDSLDLARRRTMVFRNGDDTEPEEEEATVCLPLSGALHPSDPFETERSRRSIDTDGVGGAEEGIPKGDVAGCLDEETVCLPMAEAPKDVVSSLAEASEEVESEVEVEAEVSLPTSEAPTEVDLATVAAEQRDVAVESSCHRVEHRPNAASCDVSNQEDATAEGLETEQTVGTIEADTSSGPSGVAEVDLQNADGPVIEDSPIGPAEDEDEVEGKATHPDSTVSVGNDTAEGTPDTSAHLCEANPAERLEATPVETTAACIADTAELHLAKEDERAQEDVESERHLGRHEGGASIPEFQTVRIATAETLSDESTGTADEIAKTTGPLASDLGELEAASTAAKAENQDRDEGQLIAEEAGGRAGPQTGSENDNDHAWPAEEEAGLLVDASNQGQDENELEDDDDDKENIPIAPQGASNAALSDEQGTIDDRSLVEEQQAASSSSRLVSPQASTTTTPLSNRATATAEAAVLLSRGLLACIPSPAHSLHSFSLDLSPGIGRALSLPATDALRRSIVDDVLGNLYESPCPGPGLPVESNVQGSYIERSGDNGKGRRRSARLSSTLKPSTPAKEAMLDGFATKTTPRSPERHDRKVLGELTPSSQNRQRHPQQPAAYLWREPEPSAFAMPAEAAFESPSAEAACKSRSRSHPRSRSRSQSASPKKRRDKPNSPGKTATSFGTEEGAKDEDGPMRASELFAGSGMSPGKHLTDSVRSTTGSSSPTVRSVLNAWASAKMATPFSPDKRAAVLLPQPEATVGSLESAQKPVPWNLAASLAAVSSPDKVESMPDREPSALRSPLRSIDHVASPTAQTPSRTQLAQPSSEASSTQTPTVSATRSTLRPREHLEENVETPPQPGLSLPSPAEGTAQLGSFRAPIAAASCQTSGPPTLNAPRIARTLASGAPETSRAASRTISAGASGSRTLGPRKVEAPSSIVEPNPVTGARKVAGSAVASLSGKFTASTLLRKPAAASGSALPRPVASNTSSRLPQPATGSRPAAGSAVPTQPTLAASGRAAALGPSRLATSSRPGSKITASSTLRAAGPRSATVRADGPSQAALVGSARANAASATVSATTSASAAAKRTAVATAAATDGVKKRVTGTSRVVPAVRSALAGSRSTSTGLAKPLGHGAGRAHPSSSDPTTAARGPPAETVSKVAVELAATAPTMSMLERSLQMQARALARTSPDNGEPNQRKEDAAAADASVASAASTSEPTAGKQEPVQSATTTNSGAGSSKTLGSSTSAGRVWSPVKAPGTAARLGAGGHSPIKQPGFLLPPLHLRRMQLSGSDGVTAVPPSRYGVPVSTSLSTSTSAVPPTTTTIVAPALAAAAAAVPRVRTFSTSSSNSSALAPSMPTTLAPATLYSSAGVPFSDEATPAGNSLSSLEMPSSDEAPAAAPARACRPRVVRVTPLRTKAATADPAPPSSTQDEAEPEDRFALATATTAASTLNDTDAGAALPLSSSSSLSGSSSPTSSAPPALPPSQQDAEKPGRRSARALRSAAAAASTRITTTIAGTASSNGLGFGASSLGGGGTHAHGLSLQGSISLLPLSAAELTRLTAQHTRRNGHNLSKLTVKVERREGPRPPSPSAKLKSTVSLSGGVRRKLTKAHPSLSADQDDSDGDGVDADRDADDVNDDGMPAAVGRRRHVLGKGDEEVYATPPRLAAKAGKGVRWYKSLFVGPHGEELEPEAEAQTRNTDPAVSSVRCARRPRKSSLSAKEFQLDRFGNPIEAQLEPLSPRLRKAKVTIKKIVYDGEE